jgi:Ser/Thr protein kinase RdoA (MazF antagonist)
MALAAAFGVPTGGARARELDGGYSNETWLVESSAGAVVVRRYGRLHVTRTAIVFEHAVMAHAAERMTEVVAPLRGADGFTIALDDGASVAVFPYIAGTTGARDTSAGEAAARTLARFHRAMHDVHVASGMRSARLLGTLPWLRHRFNRFAADPLVARALPWSELLNAVSAAAARIAPLAAQLPHAIVHGDVTPENVVRADGRVTGLIDFDFAHESERIVDLGVLLDEFGRDDPDGPLELTRIPRLIAAYAEEAPLTDAERWIVPEAMIRRAATLVWYVVTRHGERAPGDIGGAPRYAARVREIVAAADGLRA